MGLAILVFIFALDRRSISLALIFVAIWIAIDIVLGVLYAGVKSGYLQLAGGSDDLFQFLKLGTIITLLMIFIVAVIYVDALPNAMYSVKLFFAMIVILVAGYTRFVLLYWMQTGRWQLFPGNLRGDWETIRMHYRDYLNLALSFNAIVFVFFTVNGFFHLPFDLGPFYWFWLIALFGIGNLALALGAYGRSAEINPD